MLVPILLLAVGFVLLIKGGDWFVDGATGIARRFHLPEILIGATVVSIGTTLPEVMVSAGAAVQGSGSIAYGNAIGSIICNTSLIAALTIAIKPGPAARKSMTMPVAFFFGAAAIYCLGAYVFGTFSRTTGIVLLAVFAVYMVSTVLRMKKTAVGIETVQLEEQVGALTSEAELEARSGEDHTVESKEAGTKDSLLKDIVLLVVGAVLIAWGADLLVDNAIIIAESLGVSEKVIGLTIVALGTSLPELVTSVTAARKHQADIAIGNIVGSNIFNILFVIGLAGVFSPNPIKFENSFIIDGIVATAAVLLLWILIFKSKKLKRTGGIIMLSCYAIYFIYLLIQPALLAA